MILKDALTYILAFLAGAFLGLFYFLGLWYTLRLLPTLQKPYLIFFGSLLLRMAILLGGFYLLARVDWTMVISAMVGFILLRFLLVRNFRIRETVKGEELPQNGD